MSKSSIIAAGLLLLPTVVFAGKPAVKAHAQNLAAPLSPNTGHQISGKRASATAANLHGDTIVHHWVGGVAEGSGRRQIIDKEGDAIVHYGIRQGKPKASDPRVAVRAGLRRQSVPSHHHVVADPTTARPSLNPAQSAAESFASVPLAYTPSPKGH